MIDSLLSFPEVLLEKLKPTKPFDFLRAQPSSISEILPYECFLDDTRPTCVLSDGSLGLLWELRSIGHEALDNDSLEHMIKVCVELFEKVKDPKVCFQVIFESEPSSKFNVPAYFNNPQTSAQHMQKCRIEDTKSMSSVPRHKVTLMKRRVFLSLRLSSQVGVKSLSSAKLNGTESDFVSAGFKLMAQEIQRIADEVEYVLGHAKLPFVCVSKDSFLEILKKIFHSSSEFESSSLLGLSDAQKQKEHEAESQRQHQDGLPYTRLSSQILKDFVSMTPSAIGIGEDSWEVASLLDQPPTVYLGMMSRFLELDTPLRIVLNLRPCSDVSDLETKKMLLKNATDSFGEMQREDVKRTQDKLARGEPLYFLSMHVFVKSIGKSPEDLKTKSTAKSLCSRIKTLTQLEFIVERMAAPAIFLMNLPLCYSKETSVFSGREKRVLASNLGPYLPLFGGFKGTKTPLQLMVSRAGDPIWLSPFDSETSPHVAVLASSGGGKSFFAQNLMTSFFAKEGDKKTPLLFIIDRKTSYEIFAKVMGEDFGSEIYKPPEDFPNIFKGKLDNFRLPVIVSILKTAVSLVSKDVSLGAVEEMVLSSCVKDAFAQNELDASLVYDSGHLQNKSISERKRKIPRLKDVLDNIHPYCAKAKISTTIADSLCQNFSPFLENGPYGALFDKDAWEEEESKTPGVSLYDIDAVASHPVLSTLTTQIILSEILRQMRRPENKGIPGMLVIEEAGVLAQGSPELVAFIQEGWKTFRKLGICCVGLTNEVDDYVKKAGPREIWNVSPNKIILRMLEKDIQKALTKEDELPALIEEAHIGKLISSLRKEDGNYSQGLFWSDETRGTFIYMPTGFDYWCAASKPVEVSLVHDVAKQFEKIFEKKFPKEFANDVAREVSKDFGDKPKCQPKPYFSAVSLLAKSFPKGVRDSLGNVCSLSALEMENLVKENA